MKELEKLEFLGIGDGKIKSWLAKGKQSRMERRDAKNNLKNSEAQLNNALAQAALQPAGSGGSNVGTILGITFGLLAVAGTIGFIVYKKSAQ